MWAWWNGGGAAHVSCSDVSGAAFSHPHTHWDHQLLGGEEVFLAQEEF